MKRALTEAPVLQLPNFTEQFNLFTDASGVGIGAVLNQNHRPIAFASRTLNKAERNYTVTERGCLAVIWALTKFKTYFGSLPVEVITDHAALTKLTNGKNLSNLMIRWALKLSEFNIEWEHRPGVQNVVADVLSRNPVGTPEGSQISREVNIKVNDLVLVQTHFISAAGRRVVGKFMPQFEGSYRVLEVRNNNLIILKRGKKVTVHIDQVRVYRPRQSDTISSDCHVDTLYEGQRSSDRSSRSQPGKFKGSRKTSSEQNNGHKSRRGMQKRSLQGSEHRDQKRLTPEPKQGIKRAIPSSVSSRNHKYRRPNNPSQGSQPIAGPSHQQDSRQGKSPTVASRNEESGQYNKAQDTNTTKNGTNRAAERRNVWSKQTTAVRPCPYYLRSRIRQPEGFPEERRNSGLASIPQNSIRRRSLSMVALDGAPMDRGE
ncbi:retrovirus-related Pol polyprotein from transposon 17.6 [Trichonephila clavipes]|nr:retrovirus-related Pol polyprotein from transposon 17.6 [Trichonephila clavipes]